MPNSFNLPPNFFIRRASQKDKWKIKQILLTWKDGVNILPLNSYWCVLIIAVSVYIIINLTILALFIAIYFFYELQIRDYSNFWVIDYNGSTVGCAELRIYKKYSLLFNLCIQKDYRHQKLASAMLEHIINESQKPLYLSCFKELIPFYSRLGFITIRPENLSDELKMALSIFQDNSIIPMMLE
jgi:N-acetylglutamate synthase-like GNAT family acetyltransferase